MRATVAEPQDRGREAQVERSGRQIRDHRNTNWQRGRVWATSVLANAKSKAHQDTSGKARWHAERVQVLTRGDLFAERQREVSKGRSSRDPAERRGSQGPKEPPAELYGALCHWAKGAQTSAAYRGAHDSCANPRCPGGEAAISSKGRGTPDWHA